MGLTTTILVNAARFAHGSLLGTLCLFVGCAYLPSFHSSALPADVSPAAVESAMVPPVTLDPGDRPVGEVKPPGPVPFSPVAPPPEQAISCPPPGGLNPFLVLSLPQAVDFGLQNNPRLLSALAAIDRAQGQEQVAFAPFLPEIDFLNHGGVTSPPLGPAAAGASGIILTSNIATHSFVQSELQLQWTVWDFGRRSGRYNQAGAHTHIAELQSTRTQQTVGYDVATAYLQVLRAAAFRRIQEQAIRQARATLRDTRSRRAAGVADRDDVLRGEVHLAAAEEDLNVAQQAELAALAQLNNTLGRNASLPLKVIDWKSEPTLDLSLVQCLEIAAGGRPELSVARESVASAQFGRQAAAAEFWPRIYLLGSAGAIGGAAVQEGGQEGIGLHIDMPLYTGGKNKGNLRAADAEIRQAIADARTLLDGVTLQVTLAYLSATTAHRRVELDRPAVIQARENLRLVRSRYRNGSATPTDIVDAETALTSAQQRLASATYEYLAALVSLDFALGNAAGHLLGPPPPPDKTDPEATETLPAPRPMPMK